jgi:hypothetical protein
VTARSPRLPLALAGLQVLDVMGTSLARQLVKNNLDHLGVPPAIQRALPAIKLTTTAGLLVGTRLPRLGALTSTGMIAYYSAAVAFHLSTEDSVVFAVPSATLAMAAVVNLFTSYGPDARR